MGYSEIKWEAVDKSGENYVILWITLQNVQEGSGGLSILPWRKLFKTVGFEGALATNVNNYTCS